MGRLGGKYTLLPWLTTAVVIVILIGMIGFVVRSTAQSNMSPSSIPGWVALALAMFSIYLSHGVPAISRPRCRLFWDVQPSPLEPEEHQRTDVGSCFIRLGVVNVGPRPATDCVGRLICVQHARDGTFERVKKFDPLDLYWSRQNENNAFSPIVIQGNEDFFFLDVAQLKLGHTRDDSSLILRVVTHGEPLILDDTRSREPNAPLEGRLEYRLLIAIYSGRQGLVGPTWFKLAISHHAFSEQYRKDKEPGELEKLIEFKPDDPGIVEYRPSYLSREDAD